MNSISQKLPTHVVQHGTVKAAIWQLPGAEGTTFAISLWRLVGSSNDRRRADAFAASEIPSAAAAMLGAHLWVQDNQRKLHRRERGIT